MKGLPAEDHESVEDKPAGWRRGTWPAASLLIILSCAGWTWLSFQFDYGEGHADRPILTFVLLYACAWTGFFLGYLQLRRRDRQAPLLLILATAVVARLLLFPSGLIQENDVYRYVLDGQVLSAGVNPYQQSPLELSLLPPEPLERALSDPQAQEVISRIGYAEIPTLYPPAAQAAFAVGGLLGGWNWTGLRVLFTLVDLALIGLIVLLLTRLGSSPSRVLLYAWNPLVLKEVTNSVHLDILPAFFVVLLILSLERMQVRGGWPWLLAAAGSMAGGVLSKLYPILLLPAAFRFVSRVSGGKKAVTFAAGSLMGIVLGYLPFSPLGLDRLTEGLRSYAERWTMNQGAFDLLEVSAPPASARLRHPDPGHRRGCALGPPPVPRIAGGADRGLPVGPAVLVPPPALAFSLVRRGSGGAAARDFTVRVDGARRRRSLGRGRSLLPQLPLRVPAASGDLVDLDPAGRARVDLGDPGIRLAAIPALGGATSLSPTGGAVFLPPTGTGGFLAAC